MDDDFRFDDGFDTGGAVGMDAFFASEPQIVSPVEKTATVKVAKGRMRVGSLSQLKGFERTSADTLIRKCTQELWALHKEGEEFFIERLFQDDGQPLKG